MKVTTDASKQVVVGVLSNQRRSSFDLHSSEAISNRVDIHKHRTRSYSRFELLWHGWSIFHPSLKSIGKWAQTLVVLPFSGRRIAENSINHYKRLAIELMEFGSYFHYVPEEKTVHLDAQIECISVEKQKEWKIVSSRRTFFVDKLARREFCACCCSNILFFGEKAEVQKILSCETTIVFGETPFSN